MPIYVVDIKERVANPFAGSDESYYDDPNSYVHDSARYYKVEAASPDAAVQLALDLARAKLDSWNRTLDEYYSPSLGLPQGTGTISLMVKKIDKLRSMIDNP
jgi:hypothetical protein